MSPERPLTDGFDPNLFGPYGPRQCALRFGGHNGYFKDSNGNVQATVWCYPDHDPHGH
jgi:hypothetical protein